MRICQYTSASRNPAVNSTARESYAVSLNWNLFRQQLNPCSTNQSVFVGVTSSLLWQGLKPYAEDAAFRKKWAEIKYHNKERLAAKLKEWTGITVPVNSMYDVQIKRIHEYKRQYMNMISVIYRYKLIKVFILSHPPHLLGLALTTRVRVRGLKGHIALTRISGCTLGI